MKITYIGHSGYLVELSDCCCLFDYSVGAIPPLPKRKPLFVLVSHHHPDHYNAEIYRLSKHHPAVWYVLPPDVKLRPGAIAILSTEETEQLKQKGAAHRFLRVKSRASYLLKAEEEAGGSESDSKVGSATLEIKTLRSTDCGVAYFVRHKEAVLFHAGDLNWWAKEDRDRQYNNNMEANYKRELDWLADNILCAGEKIHAAFLPIDPKQGECYWLGFDYFLRKIKPENAFPMHFWEDGGIIGRFLKREHVSYQSRIFEPMKPREEITLMTERNQ